jgi:hypothetical protein
MFLVSLIPLPDNATMIVESKKLLAVVAGAIEYRENFSDRLR